MPVHVPVLRLSALSCVRPSPKPRGDQEDVGTADAARGLSVPARLVSSPLHRSLSRATMAAAGAPAPCARLSRAWQGRGLRTHHAPETQRRNKDCPPQPAGNVRAVGAHEHAGHCVRDPAALANSGAGRSLLRASASRRRQSWAGAQKAQPGLVLCPRCRRCAEGSLRSPGRRVSGCEMRQVSIPSCWARGLDPWMVTSEHNGAGDGALSRSDVTSAQEHLCGPG